MAKERAGIITELGLVTEEDGDRLRGDAAMVPELWMPGTGALRTSVLATWADVLAGLLSAASIAPHIPITLDLEVQVHRPATSGRDILGVASIVKAGRSVVVSEVRFHERGEATPFAIAHASFMASPNPEHRAPDGGFTRTMQERQRLSAPLAERAGSRVLAPGQAEVPKSPDGLNAAGGIQGGIVALVVEEAAASCAEVPVVLSSLGLRYLRPFTLGPARAQAEVLGDLCIVRVTDTGRDALGALATARLAPAG
ncbi:MAG: thioesterase superfamily protein [Actinomycetia bacterium]|nr:thioesterase superfamily protein [Actinomycetes bacterium]